MIKHSYNDFDSIPTPKDNFRFNDTFYTPIDVNDELQINQDRAENRTREGKNPLAPTEEEVLAALIKLRKRRRKKKQQPIFEPHPYYESQYGFMPGIEGLYSSPLEYYSGSIQDEPLNPYYNPFDNIYQSASAFFNAINKIA